MRMLEEHKVMVALCSEASNIWSYVPEILGLIPDGCFSDPLMKPDFCFR